MSSTWERYQAIYREQQGEARRQAEEEAEAKLAARRQAQREVYDTVTALLGPTASEWDIDPLPQPSERCRYVGSTCVFHLTPLFEHPGPRPMVVHGFWYSGVGSSCEHDDEGESCTDACFRTPEGVKRQNAALRCDIPGVQDRVIHWDASLFEVGAALATMLCQWVDAHARVPA